MADIDDFLAERHRRRWMKPNAHLYLRPDAARWLTPDALKLYDPPPCARTRKPPPAAVDHDEAEIERERRHLRWQIAALRLHAALIRHALCLRKANFNPAQPRDELGRWSDSGGGGSTGRVHLAASDKPSLGRSAVHAILAETARKVIEAYRSENGLWDLFRHKSGAVTVTTIDDANIFGSNSTSPTYTSTDLVEADRLRSLVLEKYPDTFDIGHVGRMPNNVLYHAETTVLLRAARASGGSLTGRTLDVYGDTKMCNNCEDVLPLIGMELGNPTVTFIGPHGRFTMKDGVWISKER